MRNHGAGPVLSGIALACLLAGLAPAAMAQESDEDITIRSVEAFKQEREEAAIAQLQRLLVQYDLERWTFTRKVYVEYRAVPHSHPVLTLSTGSLDNDDDALATYVHEQLHWYLSGLDEATERAMADLATLYPDLPTGYPDGARDEESNYLHLIVNTLEYRALEELIGATRADAVFDGYTHYRRLYDIVQDDIGAIETVMARHGIDRP